jgi:hypothetical protein
MEAPLLLLLKVLLLNINKLAGDCVAFAMAAKWLVW